MSNLPPRAWTTTSASQIKTYELCPRKWWLEKRKRLPTEHKGYLFYGTVIHNIAERFFRASDTGRDAKTDAPVELFPPGWDQVRDGWNNDGEIVFVCSDEERDRIMLQVAEAIANGTWERRPDREVESKFVFPVGDTGVGMLGYIDLCMPGEVQDHKTAKNARYATTQGKLKKGDKQLLIYAKVMAEALRKGSGADPDRILVGHNVFRKDGVPPYRVEVFYSVEMIDEAWEAVIETTREMLRASKIVSLADIDKPDAKACWAYGGCPFQGVCGQRETLERYEKRVKTLNETRAQLIQAQLQGDSDMTVFDKLVALKQGAAAAAAAPSSPAEAIAVNPPKAAGVARRMAPWADAACPACDENDVGGFNSKGNLCRICETSAPSRGVDPPISRYELDGAYSWRLKLPVEQAPAATTVAEQAAAATVVEERPVEEEPPVLLAEEKALPTKKVPAEKAGKGRPRKSFTLCVGCAPLVMPNPNSNYVSGDQLFLRFREQFCEEKGVDSYWEYDNFARRNCMALAAESIGDTLGTRTVVFSSSHTPDVRAFVEALKAVASVVYVATMG